MAQSRPQSEIYNLERERFSNFVVDLRRREEPAAAGRRPAKERFPWLIRVRLAEAWRFWRGRLGAVKPDLLAVARPAAVKRPGKKINLVWPDWLKSLFSGRRRFRFIRRSQIAPKTASQVWRRFIRQQEKILSAAPRLARAAISARSEKAERLERAESRVSWYRSLFPFILVLLVIILPLKLWHGFSFFDFSAWKHKIMSRSESAINDLMAAADAVTRQDFQGAGSQFQSAGANFLSASDELNKINDAILALAAFSNDPQVKLAAESKKFLTAGVIAASLGRHLVLATDSLFNGAGQDFSLTLDRFLDYGHQAAADAGELKATVARINPDNLPPAYRAKFMALNNQAALLADNLVNFIGLGDKLKEVLGVSRDKRYLVVFQNNAEMRASGGFLGSYALVDLRDGQISNLEVPGGGSYDTEAGLNVRVAAPQPLWLVNPLWHFWDANWWPDWPTTAKNLMWFYEHSDGPSVDGVISVTPTVVERLLEITGPIDLTQEYGLTVTAENFWQTVQVVSEQQNLAKTNPEAVAHLPQPAPNKPKKIIGDLLAKILAILPEKLNQDNLLQIIKIFEENMSEKQILLYFTDPALEAAVADYNWAGQVKDTDKDYLLVVNTNIAGQKSDRLISQQIDQTSEVAPDGTIINTVSITRTHQGVKREILTGVRNVDWLRVYVPNGSVLLSATGFQAPDPQYLTERPDSTMESNPLLAAENAAVVDPASGTKIYPENNKTVFANWVMVDPGQSATVTLKYRLPFNFFSRPKNDNWLERLNAWLNPEAAELWPYSLLVQKQPGDRASAFSSRLLLPAGLETFWRHPENLGGSRGWEIADRLNADKYWSVLVQESRQ
ncbi:MAG: DUF4012 domain-containing protein [Patescibacteria group bacterium]